MSPKPDRTAPAAPLTVKEQRAAARAAKTEAWRKREAARRRNTRIWTISGIVAAVVIIALVVTAIVLTPKPASYTAGSGGAQIEGAQTFTNTSEHVQGTVDYPQTPPAGGPHNQVWLNCGVYDTPVPNENAVHSLEHGAVWVTYDPERVDSSGVAKLRSLLPTTYAVLSPYPGLGSAVAVSAWNAQLKLDSVDDPRIAEFFEEYWKSETAPEPGALCTGGVDASGNLS